MTIATPSIFYIMCLIGKIATWVADPPAHP